EPFTPAARWSYYVHRTYAPERVGFLAADTAIDHLMRQPACWDSAANSYGLRFARAMERRIVKNTAELAGGLLTGEDLRYRRSASTAFRPRLWNAIRSSVTARMPDGAMRPAYTRFAASAIANVSTSHWTRPRIGPASVMDSLAWCALAQMQT